MSKDIGEGRWRKYGKEAVLAYCEEDVRASTALLRKQLQGFSRFQPASVMHVLHWSNYSAKAISQIQARGMQIDMVLWNLVQENKAAVISYLLRLFDPSYGSANPIYTPDGHWSDARFEQNLVQMGVKEWPRLEFGKIQTDGDAFKIMSHVPGIEGLRPPSIERRGSTRTAGRNDAMSIVKKVVDAYAAMRARFHGGQVPEQSTSSRRNITRSVLVAAGETRTAICSTRMAT